MYNYDDLIKEGNRLLSRGEYKTAQPVFDVLIQLYPESLAAFEGAIRAYSMDFYIDSFIPYDKICDLLERMNEQVQIQEAFEYEEFISRVKKYSDSLIETENYDVLMSKITEYDNKYNTTKKILAGTVAVIIFLLLCKMRYIFASASTANLFLTLSFVFAACLLLGMLIYKLTGNTYRQQIDELLNQFSDTYDEK